MKAQSYYRYDVVSEKFSIFKCLVFDICCI